MLPKQIHTHPRTGVAAVEFALCAPFLALLIVGMLELAHMANIQQTLNAANREGARFAALGKSFDENGKETTISNAQVQNKVIKALVRSKIIPDAGGVDVQVQFMDGNGNFINGQPSLASQGQLFKVVTSLPYTKISLLNFRTFMPQHLVATTTMVSIIAKSYEQSFEVPPN